MNEEQTTTESAEEAGQGTRRSLLSKGAIAAAVGAAAGLALTDRASAANGDTMIVGAIDTGTTTTGLNGGTTFHVANGGSAGDASIYGTSDDTGPAYGVHGRNTGTIASGGVAGVYGSAISEDVAGVYGIHEGGDTQSGPGVYGSSEYGPGVYGINTNTTGNGVGVRGVAEGTTGGQGVRGEAVGTLAAGVYGRATGTNSAGVEGRTTALDSAAVEGSHVAAASSEVGVGVRGTSDNGAGIVGDGTTADFVAAGTGIVQLSASAGPAITATTSGSPGSIARSVDGSLWYCYASNQWRRLDLSTPAASGVYFALTPGRVYDSRFETDGRFSGGENRTISVADSRSVTDYSVDVTDLVPAGATSVTGNVVAIGPDANGFLAINPGDVTAVTASTLNFTAGQNIANGATFALNATREVECVFGPGASAHVAIDITGYTL